MRITQTKLTIYSGIIINKRNGGVVDMSDKYLASF